MNCSGSSRRFFLKCRNLLAFMVLSVGVAVAQDRFESPRVQGVVPAARAVCVSPVTAPLGTFQPTPYIMVGGSGPAGGGYSSFDNYGGGGSLAIYGPLSAFRAVAAPVMIYSRGYDGRVYASPATSFSTPNLPGLSPVIYPTSASYYYAPRVNRTPPQWTSGMNWIDQN
jgi:hypothetical protein